MREWHKIDMDTVFAGTDQNGVRFLPEFLTDYESTFKDSVNAGCRKCLIQYYNKITKHLSSMNTESQKSQFKLKSMFAGIQLGFGSNIMVSNRNMTDAIGLQLLDNHPHGKNLFDKLPEDIDAIRSEVEANSSDDPQSTASRLVELMAMERKDLNSLAVERNIESPERYRNKTAIAEAILAIEDAGVDVSIVVNDNDEKQDPVDGGIPDIPSKSNSKE